MQRIARANLSAKVVQTWDAQLPHSFTIARVRRLAMALWCSRLRAAPAMTARPISRTRAPTTPPFVTALRDAPEPVRVEERLDLSLGPRFLDGRRAERGRGVARERAEAG